jgi:pimeloyl-ACP methyl ester carboxylesterase
MADLAHAVHGPRDGPAVLLIHGYPYDRAMWRFLVGPLTANGYRVLLPDLPGFGQSDPQPGMSMDSMADDVARLLDRLKVAKVAVVGFSMGGYVALAFAARHAQRLLGLALLDSKADADSPEGKQKREATLKEVAEHGVRAVVPGLIAAQLTEATRVSQLLLVEEVRAMMLRQSKAGVLAAVAAMRDRPDRTALMPSLAVPVLALVGEADKVTPPANATAMADAAKDGRFIAIAGAAHLTPMEQPRAVTDAVLDWLERVAPVAS